MDSLKKLPHWVWYVGGGVIGLVVLFVIASRGSSSSGSSTTAANTSGTPSTSTQDSSTLDQIQGELAQQTAAYEGLQTTLQNLQSGTGSGNQGASGSEGTLTLAGAAGQANQGIWANSVAAYSNPSQVGGGPGQSGIPITLPFGSYDIAGSPIAANGAPGGLYPIVGPGGQTLYVLGENVRNYTAGSGGS